MKKVLVFGLSKNRGGIETVFKTFYEELRSDDYLFDFVARDGGVAFQDEFKQNGSRIYEVSNFLIHPIKYYKQIRKIITSEKYDVIHVNMLSAANPLPIIAASKSKNSIIVAHAHNNNTCGILRKILHCLGKHIVAKYDISRIACSDPAGEYLFGKMGYTVVYNPFDYLRFSEQRKREKIRSGLNIKDSSIVIGNIGRLSKQKNPQFLVDVLAEIKNKTALDYKLVFVGEGSYRKKIIKRAARKGITDDVIFVGSTDCPEDYYGSFDIFAMPSIFEGLGMVALEAQASGLPCVLSNNVPKEVGVTDAKHIELDTKKWADNIIALRPEKKKVHQEAFSKFDSHECAGLLAEAYNGQMAPSKVDFVIMWVDPNDPEWQAEKAKYTPKSNTDSSARRYRDWDNLRYWFRGVESYAPWVNNIYFVTCGHIPKWLNVNHPKLKIVKHSEFIPQEYLPTFSANPIEMNLHRIKGLSEKFVFFNDDFFLINKTTCKDFFKKNKPCDSACMYINIPSGNVVDSLFSNDMTIINKHFSMREVLRKNFFKWINPKNGKYLYSNIVLSLYGGFAGIHFSHLPASFCKGTYRELWNAETDTLDNTCRNRFRSTEDVNQWLIKYWQICSGRFVPRRTNWGKYYESSMGREQLKQILTGKKYKAVCINDTVSDEEYEDEKQYTNDLLKQLLPNKSKYER